MGTLKDLTNQKFGLLTVINRAPDHISPNGRKRVKWHCKCECGNEIDVFSDNLTRGKTLSCGCYNDKQRKARFNDITNQVFGQLTALYPTDRRNASGEIIWHCKCTCGNEVDVSLGDLRSHHTTSCGCTRYKKLQEHFMIDLTGQKFNYLTVLYPIFNEDNTFSRKWHCRCDCGKELDIYSQALKTQISCGCKNISKGENKIKNILIDNCVKFEEQKTFPDLKNKDKYLRFDFCIYNNKNQIAALIEYQGIQHYEEVSFFNHQTLKERQINDQKKREYCINHDLLLIEIPYYDYNNLSWEYIYEKIKEKK